MIKRWLIDNNKFFSEQKYSLNLIACNSCRGFSATNAPAMSLVIYCSLTFLFFMDVDARTNVIGLFLIFLNGRCFGQNIENTSLITISNKDSCVAGCFYLELKKISEWKPSKNLLDLRFFPLRFDFRKRSFSVASAY